MIKTPMRKQAEAEKMRQEIRALVRPALAVIWSIIWVVIFLGTGEMPPEFVTGITGTCIIWFFSSREVEKKDARKAL